MNVRRYALTALALAALSVPFWLIWTIGSAVTVPAGWARTRLMRAADRHLMAFWLVVETEEHLEEVAASLDT